LTDIPPSLDVARRTERRVPRWAELKPFVRTQPLHFRPAERRLAHAHTVEDLRRIARRRTPRSVFDYVDGGAELEVSMRRSRRAFASAELRPTVLQDVSNVVLATTILGAPSALPLVLAPTGLTRLVNHAGEIAVARAAARAGIPYTLSTMGTTTIEDLPRAAPTARQWFQLYLWKDRDASADLIRRAEQSGYEAIMLTVDTPVGGARLRDVRNGFTIPPSLTARTLAGMATHPTWWWNLLTTEPLAFASFSRFDGTVEQLIGHMFDPGLTTRDVTWLRSRWPRKLIIKGITNVEDARTVADLGVDAIVVSDHGGRQLDRGLTPIEVLPEIVAAVGDQCEVIIDSGVRSGTDIAVGKALGASAAMIGRAYLYGLMAAGERGVDRVIDILRTELHRTVQLLGAPSVDALSTEHVQLRCPW
jgi:L-lactate dehydrogenase (cytochrome)